MPETPSPRLVTQVMAIDPGPQQSAIVRWNGREVLQHEIMPNGRLRGVNPGPAVVVIEMLEGRGGIVGQETFDTAVWIGRFMEVFNTRERIYRRVVKMHMCGTARAKDSHIRLAILDRFPKGNKRDPGPTYGLKADCWQALALAITWWDQMVNDKDRL